MKIAGIVTGSRKWPEFCWRRPIKPGPIKFSEREYRDYPDQMPRLRIEEVMEFEFSDLPSRERDERHARTQITLKANEYTIAKQNRVVWEGIRILGVFGPQDEERILREVLYGAIDSRGMKRG